MRYSILFTIALSCLCWVEYSMAQLRFQSVIGGPGYFTAGYGIAKTIDDGYAVTGVFKPSGSPIWHDVYVAKLDNTGSLLWTRTIGDSLYDLGLDITQTFDGGFAVAGRATTANVIGLGLTDGYVIKINSAGNVQWTSSVGGYEMDEFRSIVQASDGGYVAAGYSSTFCFGVGYSDVYVVKLNFNGSILWSRNIGGIGSDYGTSVVQTNDAGFIISGYTNSFGQGNFDMYCVKLNYAGVLEWTTTVGGPQSDYGYSIIQTSDGGYAMVGYTNSYGAGLNDIYVAKLGASGNLQWTRTIGGSGDDQGLDIIQTVSGDYIVSGTTNSFGAGSYDYYLAKLNSNGILLWTRTIGGPGEDRGYNLVADFDQGFTVVGSSNSHNFGSGDMFVVKLDSNGIACSNHGTGGTVGFGGVSSSGGVTGSGGATTSGGISASAGTGLTLCYTTSIDEVEGIRFAVSPNPSSGKVQVAFEGTNFHNFTLLITDLLGKIIYENQYTNADSKNIYLDLSDKPTGIYLVYAFNDSTISEPLKLMINNTDR